MDAGVVTQEVIYGASNYKDILGGSFNKCVKRMVYCMLDKTLGGENQVEDYIPLAARRFSYLNSMEYIHDISSTRGRLHADGREAELEPG